MIIGKDDEENLSDRGMGDLDMRTIVKDRRAVRDEGGTSLENIPVGQAAKIHETSRMKAVAEMYSLLGMLAREQALDDQVFFDFAGAKEQDGKGSSFKKTQAAHCLPGHLTIDHLRLDSYLKQPPGGSGVGIHKACRKFLQDCHFRPDELCGVIAALFGRTEIAITRLNQADSHIELFSAKEFGLKEAFAIYAGQIVSGPSRGGLVRAPWEKVLDIVSQEWRGYCTMATEKTAAAIGRKEAELKAPCTKAEATLIKLRIRILQAYYDTVKAGAPPHVLNVDGFESLRQQVMTS